MGTEATLETSVDFNPSPRVKITFTTLVADTERITIYSTADGMTKAVREATRIFAIGGVTADDYEPPFGVTITYRAMQYDAIGNELGYTDPAETIVEYAGAVLSDPLQPTKAMPITLTANAGQRPERIIPGKLHQVGTRVVALVGYQGKLSRLNMDFYTDTTIERRAVEELIAGANGLVLIRTSPPMMVPRALYCFAGSATPDETNLPAGIEDVEWFNTVDEVPPTELGYGVPLVTWQDYIDAFPTWADFNAAYINWLDAMTNPPGA